MNLETLVKTVNLDADVLNNIKENVTSRVPKTVVSPDPS
jgi:hypothetical protein